MTFSFDGKTALVTGASRGIGREIAVTLGTAKAFVIAHYGRGKTGAEDTVRRIEAAGGTAVAIGADLTRGAEISAMFTEVDAILARSPGRGRLDVLVNNAGVGGGGSLRGMKEEAFDRLFATNVKGLFLVTQHAVERLNDGGRIVNLSSMVSLAAYPGAIAYAMTKAAVNSLTRSLAVDLGPRRITVNAVAPGATDTDFIRALLDDPKLKEFYASRAALGRIGTTADIAAVVAFLASQDSGWITGQVLEASGGMHL